MAKNSNYPSKEQRLEMIRSFLQEITEQNEDIENSLSSLKNIMKQLATQKIYVTEPTLSRDLRELGYIKIDGIYVYQVIEYEDEYIEEKKFLRHNVIDDVSENESFYLKTVPGTGKGVASRLNQLFSDYIWGTIADDNVVLVITNQGTTASELYNAIINIETERDTGAENNE